MLTPPDTSAEVQPHDHLAVRVTGLGKRFRIYSSPWDRVAEWISLNKIRRHTDFWALRGIDFSVRHGESVGIIGVNGSGKSTLLRLLTGCLHPTEGHYTIQGRVLSLLELGTGMNVELTGRQNIVFSSVVLGMPPNYAQEKMEVIESFAELGDFFDRPVKLYSTGMLVRLAFSMFAAFEPDLFIVDEALSVGDIFFQQKCVRRIEQLRERGTTLLFVSHQISAIEALCDRVLVLHQGQQQHFGDKIKGIQIYYALSGATAGAAQSTQEKDALRRESPAANTASNSSGAVVSTAAQTPLPPLDDAELAQLPWQAPDETDKVGDDSLCVEAICLRRDDGQYANHVDQGRDLDIFVRLRATRDVGPVSCGLHLYDRFHQVVFAQGWLNAQLQPLWLKKDDVVFAGFRVRMDLEAGAEYVLCLGASQPLADAGSPTGWNQHVGGQRYTLLPRSTCVTVLPRPDKARYWFGATNLRTCHQRKVVRSGARPS
ncbi:MAG TPA: ABC transporter ATP-binding protein [Tepidisphaeraceae bacterium]|nr:ABC transporter ATP-binding protein [Tepidisphaeraceae bacterium]